MFLKEKQAIKCTAYSSCWIENSRWDIGNCQPGFAKDLGVVAGLLLATRLMRSPTLNVGLMGKCRVSPKVVIFSH